jgi:heme A synthase
VVVGLLLATALVLVGALTVVRQRRALRALADEPFVADEDRRYRRGQARRRMVTSGLLVVIGGMIAGHYLSGMDARMDAIGAPPREGEPDPRADADKQFTKFVGFYWIGIMGLVFVAVCFAVVDFWATRKYWMARYKELKADHEAKLQRDLAVFRQKKLNERVPGLKPPGPPDDTTTDEPPV